MEALTRTFLPLAITGTIATMVAWQGMKLWEQSLGHGTLALKLGAVFVPATAAGLIYWLGAVMFKIPAATEMSALIFQKLHRNK
jgi:hypothetical protein